MLDEGGGQPVEVITVSEEAEFHPGGGHSSAGTTPRGGPSSPGVLATAHVRTK